MQGLYNHGARNFLLINSVLGGCSPIFLVEFNGTKDSHGCLEDYNTIYQQHRTVLKREVKTLRFLYPDSQIIFADYYDAYMNILNAHAKYGKLYSLIRISFIGCRGAMNLTIFYYFLPCFLPCSLIIAYFLPCSLISAGSGL